MIGMARVLITGTSTGIGRAAVTELAARGHDVIATARRTETLAGLPATLRLQLDVTDQASVDAAVASAGPLDAVVSNAGETIRGSVEATPLSEYERLLDLNFLGALRVTKAVLPAFRQQRAGHIVLVSSILGRLAIPMISGYAASKFALEALAETLAMETRHLGIHITTLQPGRVDTDGAAKAPKWADSDDSYTPVWGALSRSTGAAISAQDVATVIADTIEDPDPPLRIAVGGPARQLLAAWHSAPADQPFSTTRP
jgi:NADP-dependent 3-hydroxy acid dehydrogenase YdfG